MSGVLYRWGRLAALRPWRVLAVWLVVVGGVAGLLVTQTPSISTALTLQDAPAQEVLDEIEVALPEAGGTQGAIVFTARDGGRVDEPARAVAIGDAMDSAMASGIVVNRDERLAEQQAQLEATVRTTVESRVAGELSGELESLVTALESARQSLAGTLTGAPPAQSEPAVLLAERVDAVVAAGHALLALPDGERIAGAAGFFSDVADLRASLAAAGVAGVDFPEADAAMSDPVAAVDAGVSEGTRVALDRLAGLTEGTSPRGTALVTSDGVRSGVVVSDDGTTAVATLQLAEQASDLPAGSLEDLLAGVDAAAEGAGLEASASSALLPLEAPLGGHEVIGLAVAALVLVLTLGSLVLAGLPILTALIGVFIGVGGAYALSANFVMTTSTPALGLMLGLAVGIDYALFIVNKQRTLRARFGLDPVEATGRAVATAGGAVLFAGTTVIIALLGLLTLGMGFVTTMAVTAAVTVALAVALALTALPALLGLVGARGRLPRRDVAGLAQHTWFDRAALRWVGVVTRRPVATIAVVVLGLGVLAIPAASIHLGMPSGAVSEPSSEQRVAYDGVASTLGEGANAPLVVALTPRSGTTPDLEQLEAWQAELAARDLVANVKLMASSDDASLVLFTVVPDAGPTDQATADLVAELRATALDQVDRIGVTGLTALNIDLSDALAAAIPVYLALVAGLSLVVLLLVFRSLVVPLAATAGFLLSIDLPFERTAERNAYRASLVRLEGAVRAYQAAEDALKESIRAAIRALRETREQLKDPVSGRVARRAARPQQRLAAGQGLLRSCAAGRCQADDPRSAWSSAIRSYRVRELDLQKELGLLEVTIDGVWREPDMQALGVWANSRKTTMKSKAKRTLVKVAALLRGGGGDRGVLDAGRRPGGEGEGGRQPLHAGPGGAAR